MGKQEKYPSPENPSEKKLMQPTPDSPVITEPEWQEELKRRQEDPNRWREQK